MKDMWSSGYYGQDIVEIYRGPSTTKYFTIDWMLHDRCTYDCSYCPPSNKSGTDSWLDLDKLDEFCDSVEAHVAQVDPGSTIRALFTGGEPTVWKGFTTLIDRLHSRGWSINVVSNGSRSARWWEENAAKFTEIHLSYHTEGVDDDEFMEKVLICERHTATSVNVMLNSRPELFIRAVDFGARLKQETKYVCITQCRIQHTFGLQEIGVPFYTAEQKKIIDELTDHYPIEYIDNYKIFVNDYKMKTVDGREMHLHPIELINYKKANFENWMCSVGLESIFIDARGDIIRGTCRVGDVMGNIIDPANIKWVKEPIRCPLTWCSCVTDIRNTKNQNT
jgi:organic radical activating enzyme